MLRKILLYPDPFLATVAKPVEEINDQIKQIATDMFDTLNHVGGVGLAATQIGEPYRMVIIDRNLADPDAEVQDLVLVINPKLTILDPKKHKENEGCLSVAGLRSEVARPCHVKVTGVDLDNNPIEIEGKEYLSACIQHECDHLDGKTFITHLSNLKRTLYNKKLKR